MHGPTGHCFIRVISCSVLPGPSAQMHGFLSLALVSATLLPYASAFIRGGCFWDVAGKISISHVCPSSRASSHGTSRSVFMMNTESNSPDSALWASLRKRISTQDGAAESLPTADKMVNT